MIQKQWMPYSPMPFLAPICNFLEIWYVWVIDYDIPVLQAAQIMIGLIHCALGYIWMHLYIGEIELLSLTYMPIALLSGYPFMATLTVSK